MNSNSLIKVESFSDIQGVSKTIYRTSSNNESSSIVNNTSFLAETLCKEVISQDQLSGKNRKLKSLKKLHKGFVSILVTAMMVSPNITFAQDTGMYNNMMTPVSSDQEITPSTVMQWGMSISLVTVAIGVAIASSLLVIAGVYKMLRKEKEAEQWTTDIIKGLVQVLIAIPIVYSLFYLAQIVFKRLPVLEGLM